MLNIRLCRLCCVIVAVLAILGPASILAGFTTPTGDPHETAHNVILMVYGLLVAICTSGIAFLLGKIKKEDVAQ